MPSSASSDMTKASGAAGGDLVGGGGLDRYQLIPEKWATLAKRLMQSLTPVLTLLLHWHTGYDSPPHGSCAKKYKKRKFLQTARVAAGHLVISELPGRFFFS